MRRLMSQPDRYQDAYKEDVLIDFMKITCVAPHDLVAGGVKALMDHASYLAKRGHDVTIVCVKLGLDKKSKLRNLVDVPLSNIRKQKPSWMNVACKVHYVSSLSEKTLPDADILMTTAWQNTRDVSQVSPRKGKRVWFIQHYERISHAQQQDVPTLDALYRAPSHKIVISHWLKDILKEKYHQQADHIVTPVDFVVPNPTEEKNNQPLRICIMNHIADWKGVPEGLKAMEIVKKKHPEVRLVMGGARDRAGPQICDEYHYGLGPDDFTKLINTCDIFVCPSWYEGLAMPSMDALSCKTALVTTDNGGSRDYSFHEKTALVSPPRDPEALAQNIITAIENSKMRHQIAVNGYNHVKQFTWEKAAESMERVFERILA